MSEKKLNQSFEMGDEALKSVTDGQGYDAPAMDPSLTTETTYTGPELEPVFCPECGGDLYATKLPGSSGDTYLTTVCPHCKKVVTVAV